MSLLSKNDVVKYACTCGQLKSISFMYFCRHCLELRCGFCIWHEVESHYCSNCLEMLPSAEARLKKNRCQTCFDCPNCLNTLAVRGTTSSVRDAEDPSKVNSQKKYYHACFFCRWTTRDVGLPDQAVQTVSANGWERNESNCSHIQRVTVLLERARLLGTLERHEREQREKKFTPRSRRTYTHFPGLTSAQVRKRAGLPPEMPAPSTIKETLAEFQPAISREEVEALPADIFTKELDLSEITTMPQRLAQPQVQPVKMKDILPMHKLLSIKRSQRCRECQHNVIKPEMNPASIKFKIQQTAYVHVPEVRLVTAEPLFGGKESQVVILFSNPLQNPTSLSFIPLKQANDEAKKKTEGITDASEPQAEAASSISSITKSGVVLEEPRPINIKVTGRIQLPGAGVEIMLPPKDDAAEYDYSGETHKSYNDPKWVMYRRANKAAISFTVTPCSSFVDENCIIGFALRYTYINRISSPGSFEQKQQPQEMMSLVAYGSSGESENESDNESIVEDRKAVVSASTNGTVSISILQSVSSPVEANANIQTVSASSSNHCVKTGLHCKLPPPKTATNEIVEDYDEESPTVGSKLPAPKHHTTPSLLHSSIILPRDLKGKNKRGTVKIMIPSLTDFPDDEDEPKTRKKIQPSTKGSGLFALLPPPKQSIVTVKEVKRALVPNVLARKSTPAPPVKKVIPKHTNKPVKRKQPDSEPESDEENESMDFFSLNKEDKLPDIPMVVEDSIATTSDNYGSSTSAAYQESALSHQQTADYQYPHYEQQTEESIQPQANSGQDFISFQSSGDLQLNDEALTKLCGRRGRKREEIQILDVSGDSIMPDQREWLTKQLTEEQPRSSSKSKLYGSSSQQKRKHQITYLAHMAKENEIELKNQWANNRQTRKQTQSKYGF